MRIDMYLQEGTLLMLLSCVNDLEIVVCYVLWRLCFDMKARVRLRLLYMK